VVVRLQLTHELIGRLIGARRPTVSLALHALAEEGILERRDADSWRLAHDSSLMIERHMGTDGVPIVSSK
jgi:DNA-binding IclR family transcriptional regulator